MTVDAACTKPLQTQSRQNPSMVKVRWVPKPTPNSEAIGNWVGFWKNGNRFSLRLQPLDVWHTPVEDHIWWSENCPLGSYALMLGLQVVEQLEREYGLVEGGVSMGMGFEGSKDSYDSQFSHSLSISMPYSCGSRYECLAVPSLCHGL